MDKDQRIGEIQQEIEMLERRLRDVRVNHPTDKSGGLRTSSPD